MRCRRCEAASRDLIGALMDRTSGPDRWASWLLWRRQGGPELPAERLEQLHRVRDHVLDNARLMPDDVVLDVGCGDGLIGFAALARLGEKGRVILSDISEDLLERCRSIAREAGILDRCEFLLARADDLAALAEGSVDVVFARSVLIYVADKERALREFYRVLRPGGRVSIYEPINRFTFPEPKGFFYGYDLRSVEDIVTKVRAEYGRHVNAQNPMLAFDERDLLRLTEKAGFGAIHMEYRVDIERKKPEDFERFLRSSGNPLVPTLEEAIENALTPDERELLVSRLRPLLESGNGAHRLAVAFLSATRHLL
jgi:arsenite methyltransferase